MIKPYLKVETLAELGVVFIFFALGVELCISKLRRVQGVALLGGIIEIFLMMLICGVFSDFTGAPSTEGIFVGAFISMSSTAVVIKCLVDRCALQSLDSQIVVGTLILQDCTVGFLFALLPVLSGSRGSGEAVMSFVRVIAMMFLFFIMAVAIRPLVAQILNNVYAYNENLYQMVRHCFKVMYRVSLLLFHTLVLCKNKHLSSQADLAPNANHFETLKSFAMTIFGGCHCVLPLCVMD